MWNKRLAWAVWLMVPVMIVVAGCVRPRDGQAQDRPADFAVGRSDHAMSLGGRTRTYRVYRPTRASPRPALVVMLHGGFGSGRQAEDAYGWDPLADAKGFVVAYPDGLDRAWNVGGGCCGKSGRDGVNDVEFILRMIEEIRRGISIDPRRIYATGISNGGMLSYRLACDTRGVFAAIGPVAATMLADCTSPEQISVIHVHGTADEAVRYDGRPGTGAGRIDGPPVPVVMDHWRRIDRCATGSDTTDGAVTTSSVICPEGRGVTLITIDGVGHQWPGSEPTRAQRLLGADEPSTDLDATSAVWDFFAARPRHS